MRNCVAAWLVACTAAMAETAMGEPGSKGIFLLRPLSVCSDCRRSFPSSINIPLNGRNKLCVFLV